MNRKALIFSLAYYPHLVGGAEVAIKEITDRIQNDDIEFDMITLYAGARRFERIGNINVYRVGPKIHIEGNSVKNISYFIKFQYVALAFFKALLLERKRHYDFIWSVMASFNGFSALFVKIVFRIFYKNIPFLLTLQEGDSLVHIKKALGFMYPLYLQIFRNADYIQAISRFLEEFGKKMGAKCPSRVVPNGVDFEHFSKKPTLGQIRALKDELKLNENDIVLITTSRLVQKNGLSDLIESFTYLQSWDNREFKLIILGTGPLENFLKEKTKVLKLEDRVKFVGYVRHTEMPLYLHISDIFIRPSISEGMGVSFIEAMASDVPVIATPVGGIIDFLKEGETGLFCMVNDPESIAKKVNILLDNKNLRENIVKNARDMVKKNYNWSLIAEEMRSIFYIVNPKQKK